MASEALVQAVMQEFSGMSASQRKEIFTQLALAKASQVIDGSSLVGDPKMVQMLKAIMDSPGALDAGIEALRRLEQQDKKKGGFFGFLKRS